MSVFFLFIPPPLSGTFPASRNLRFLTIGLWNANGRRNKATESKDFICASNADIVLVSETYFFVVLKSQTTSFFMLIDL